MNAVNTELFGEIVVAKKLTPTKTAVHAALLRALDAGFTQEQISEKTGIKKGTLSLFKREMQLGPEKLSSLKTWLVRNGFLSEGKLERPQFERPTILPLQQSLFFRDSSERSETMNRQERVQNLDYCCHECKEWVVGPRYGAVCCYMCGSPFFNECRDCGKLNPLEDVYCGKCGHRLGAKQKGK